jgi:hypothetical protein
MKTKNSCGSKTLEEESNDYHGGTFNVGRATPHKDRDVMLSPKLLEALREHESPCVGYRCR